MLTLLGGKVQFSANPWGKCSYQTQAGSVNEEHIRIISFPMANKVHTASLTIERNEGRELKIPNHFKVF